jgi:imidazoleglycerol-phosphate dehydratase
MTPRTPRTTTITRKTNETDIALTLCLDGGDCTIETGVGFFDHMLTHLARHGHFGLKVNARGDVHVDDHHTVEDVGIVLGKALEQTLSDKRGIERYGFASVPMEDALARVSIDLSGRPALVLRVNSPSFTDGSGKIGSFDTQLIPEFLTALVNNGRFNCHVEVPHGSNHHHIAEAIFKALGRALQQAVAVTGSDVPSTKGVL